MERLLLSRQVLLCGIRYGKDGLSRCFGNELSPLMTETLSELHKNNLPEEEILFALVRLVKRRNPDLPDKLVLPREASIEDSFMEMKSTEAYRSIDRLNEISEFRQKSVLEDLVYYLTQLLHERPESLSCIQETFRNCQDELQS